MDARRTTSLLDDNSATSGNVAFVHNTGNLQIFDATWGSNGVGQATDAVFLQSGAGGWQGGPRLSL